MRILLPDLFGLAVRLASLGRETLGLASRLLVVVLPVLGLGSLRFSNEIPVGSSPPSSKRLGLRRLPRRELGAGLFLRLPEVPKRKRFLKFGKYEIQLLALPCQEAEPF